MKKELPIQSLANELTAGSAFARRRPDLSSNREEISQDKSHAHPTQIESGTPSNFKHSTVSEPLKPGLDMSLGLQVDSVSEPTKAERLFRKTVYLLEQQDSDIRLLEYDLRVSLSSIAGMGITLSKFLIKKFPPPKGADIDEIEKFLLGQLEVSLRDKGTS